MNNVHDVNNIHDNGINNISECNLLHDIFNPSKFVKITNSDYYPILHGCINKRRGEAE